MDTLVALEEAVLELRALLARPDNDYSWSSWPDPAAALAEVDRHLAQLRAGVVPDLSMLLVATGPAQEVALSSGWGDAYLALAERIEQALARI
jgi:hypothetical protein